MKEDYWSQFYSHKNYIWFKIIIFSFTNSSRRFVKHHESFKLFLSFNFLSLFLSIHPSIYGNGGQWRWHDGRRFEGWGRLLGVVKEGGEGLRWSRKVEGLSAARSHCGGSGGRSWLGKKLGWGESSMGILFKMVISYWVKSELKNLLLLDCPETKLVFI